MSEKNKSMKTPKCLKMCLMVVSRTSTHSILSAVYCKKRSQFPDFDNKAPVTWSPLHDDKHVADSKGILFSYNYFFPIAKQLHAMIIVRYIWNLNYAFWLQFIVSSYSI